MDKRSPSPETEPDALPSAAARVLRATLQLTREVAAVAVVGAYAGAAAASLFGLTNLLPQLLIAGSLAGVVVGLVVAVVGRQPDFMRAARRRLRRWGLEDVSATVGQQVAAEMRAQATAGRKGWALGVGLLGLGLFQAALSAPAWLAWLAPRGAGQKTTRA